MNRNWWLLYIAFYLAFSGWAYMQVSELHQFNITDAFYLVMVVGVIGFALKIKIISLSLWRIIFGLSVLVLIHAWVVMPIIYLNEELQLSNIAIIQLFAVPALPLFLGIFNYAWRSSDIWVVHAQQGAQPGRS